MNDNNQHIENIKRFESLLMSVKRKGMQALLTAMIRGTDFYTAPASQSYYKAYPGGLLEHSLNVYEILYRKATEGGSVLAAELAKEQISQESLILIGLLHDIYKVNRYVAGEKNIKEYDPELVADMLERSPREVKTELDGRRYFWKTKPVYTVEDQFPLGTTDKSIMMIQPYIRLTWDEMMGIKWANGPENMDLFIGSAKKYPIALAAYEAKMEAMYFLD